jgi:transposase-like protein
MSEAQHTPVAGQDYPQTWGQFEDWFASEIDCLRYLERLRWREGFVCPRCGCRDDPYRADRARLICRACRLQCTVTSGTIFDKTRTPLKVWLAAAWYLTSQKSGVSALGLQRVLGLGSYQTAWTMLHRFRRAMELWARANCCEVSHAGFASTGTCSVARRASRRLAA